jgi:hypothetical protein
MRDIESFGRTVYGNDSRPRVAIGSAAIWRVRFSASLFCGSMASARLSSMRAASSLPDSSISTAESATFCACCCSAGVTGPLGITGAVTGGGAGAGSGSCGTTTAGAGGGAFGGGVSQPANALATAMRRAGRWINIDNRVGSVNSEGSVCTAARRLNRSGPARRDRIAARPGRAVRGDYRRSAHKQEALPGGVTFVH